MGEIQEKDFIHFIQKILLIDTNKKFNVEREVIISEINKDLVLVSKLPNSLNFDNKPNKKIFSTIEDPIFTENEQIVLNLFRSNINKVIKAKDIALKLGVPRDYIYKYIKNLRKKLGPDTIQNVSTGGFIYTKKQDCNEKNNSEQLTLFITKQDNTNTERSSLNSELSQETKDFLKLYKSNITINNATDLRSLKQKYHAKNKIIDDVLDYMINVKGNFTKTIYPDSRRLRNYNLTPNLLSILYSMGYYWLDNLNNIDMAKIIQINGMGASYADELLDLLYAENMNFIPKDSTKKRLSSASLSPQAKVALYKYYVYYYEDLANIDLFDFKAYTEITVKPFEEIVTFLISNNIPFKQYEKNKVFIKDVNFTLNTKVALYSLRTLYLENIKIAKLRLANNIGKGILKEIEQKITQKHKIDIVKPYLISMIKNMHTVTIGSLLDYCLNEGYDVSQVDIQLVVNEICIKIGKNSYIYNESL